MIQASEEHTLRRAFNSIQKLNNFNQQKQKVQFGGILVKRYNRPYARTPRTAPRTRAPMANEQKEGKAEQKSKRMSQTRASLEHG